MKSVTTERFRKAYSLLPDRVKEVAKKSYRKWKENPRHVSLQFKQIHNSKQIYSVRVGLSYRAIGVRQGRTMIWFWIGHMLIMII